MLKEFQKSLTKFKAKEISGYVAVLLCELVGGAILEGIVEVDKDYD